MPWRAAVLMALVLFIVGCVDTDQYYEQHYTSQPPAAAGNSSQVRPSVEFDSNPNFPQALWPSIQAVPPNYSAPDEKSLTPDEMKIREEIFNEMGVEIADGGCKLASGELKRFKKVLEAFHKIGAIDGKLKVIAVNRGPENATYGTRPQAFMTYQTLMFWCNTSGSVPEGYIFDTFPHLFEYFSHELGHILNLDKVSGRKTEQEHQQLYQVSVDPTDFVSEYAKTNQVEDYAETCSSAYSERDLFPYMFYRQMNDIFRSSPVLAKKVLNSMELVATKDKGRLLVLITPSGEYYDVNKHIDVKQDDLQIKVIEFDITRDGSGRINGFTLPPDLTRPDLKWNLHFDRPQ